MKTMKKIVAVVAVALLLCSILPLSVFAAAGDTHTVDFSTISGSVQYAEETHDLGGGISLHIVKCHINSQLRIYSSSSNNGIATFTSEEPIASFVMNAGNKADTVNIYTSADGSTWTLDQGVAVSSTYTDYTVTLAAPSKYIQLDVAGTSQVRIKTMTFTFGEEAAAGCDHASLACGATCSNCGEYTQEHRFSNTCVAECERGCGTANPDYVAGHSYTGTYDATCNICNAIREVAFPEDGSELTIAQIIEICASMDSGATTSAKYYVSGEITEIYNTTYGNMYITDGTDALTIYGTYDADGTNRFDAMTEKPEAGNTVKLYGKIGPYNGTAQMQYAWIIEITGGCEHTYEYECSKACSLCGLELRPEAACVNDGYACLDGLCIYCGGDVAGLGHDFDDQWDPDCNYGCGETREVEERPEMSEATITFDEAKTQRTEYTTDVQVWTEGTLVLTNNKGASTSNVGDYSAPGRFYKSSDLIIAFPGMTSLVIDATGIGSKYLWEATLDAAGLTYTVSEQVYTITFDEAVDSITLTMANQARANTITATAVKASEPECEHEYTYACDQICCKCYELTNPNAAHSVKHVEAVAATCSVNGNIEYWYCEYCGSAWADEAHTIVTNMMSVVTPATGEHTYDNDQDADCNVCGDVREVVAAVYGDANGDGSVDGIDAALLQQYVAGWEVSLNETADANGDGSIDGIDAALLQQYVAGWEVSLG